MRAKIRSWEMKTKILLMASKKLPIHSNNERKSNNNNLDEYTFKNRFSRSWKEKSS